MTAERCSECSAPAIPEARSETHPHIGRCAEHAGRCAHCGGIANDIGATTLLPSCPAHRSRTWETLQRDGMVPPVPRAPIAPAFPPDDAVIDADSIRVLGVTCKKVRAGGQTGSWIGHLDTLEIVVSAIPVGRGAHHWHVSVDDAAPSFGPARVICRVQGLSFAEAVQLAEAEVDRVVATIAALERARHRSAAIGELPGAVR